MYEVSFKTGEADLESEYRPDPDIFIHRRRLDRVLRWLRSCAVCGSALPPIDLLCGSCWEVFDRLRNRSNWLAQPGYPFPVYSLLTWTEETDAFVKPFIYGLKRGFAVGAVEKLSQVFSFERRWPKGEERPVFLYPPASGSRPDHATLLTKTFARYWQTSAYELERPYDDPGDSQKHLDVGSRSLRRFETALGPARFEREEAPRVFCDDVITSGATAKAAWMALSEPERFEVWTLVCRPKLAALRHF